MNRKTLNRCSIVAIIAVIAAFLVPANLTLVYASGENPRASAYHKIGVNCIPEQTDPINNNANEEANSFSNKRESGWLRFFCDNFNNGMAERWEPKGGTWAVQNGQYVGTGLSNTPCLGFSNNETLIRNLKASNVDIQVDMKSIQRVDKGIILRSTGPGNQIELNFRAERPGAFPADLIVQEIVNCHFILYTPEFSVLIPPHQVGQTIHVRATLIHNRLHVWIDGHLVLNRTFPFAATKGQVGLAVIDGGTTAFDNVQVHVLK